MKRPLLVLAVGYIIGIVWGLYCNCSIALLYAFFIPVYFVLKQMSKTTRQFKIFSIKRYFRYPKLFLKFNVIITIIVFSVVSNTIVINQNKKYSNLYANASNVTIIGIIVSNKTEKEYKNVYKIKVQSVNGNIRFRNTYLLLNIKKEEKNKIEYGNEVLVNGEFKAPSTRRNYKGFDYKEYLKTQKVYGTVNTTSVKVTNSTSVNDIFIISNNMCTDIKRNFESVFPKKYSNLLNAIMLGNTAELDEDILQNFRDSNIAHILAVSGIHITYITLGITKTLNLLIGKRNSKIVAIIILIIYMFITGFSPSVVRATIMGGMFLFGKIIYRKNDTLNTLSISILCMLVYNPFLILNAGVLLSYGGVIGIIIFNKNILNRFEKIKVKNIRYKYKIKKYEKYLKYIKENLAVYLSIQIIILPIIINTFNTFGILAIITNLLLSIIIEPIIIFGLVAVFTSVLFPKFLNILAYPIIGLLKLLMLLSESGSILPFNKIYITTLNISEIIIYYILIFSINCIYKIYNKKKPSSFEYRFRNILSLVKYKIKLNKSKVFSVIVLSIFIFTTIKIIPKKLQIHFIDVGQGDSTLILTPMKKSILIDGGGSENFDIGKNTLLPYLLDRKIKKMDYIIISHFDTDHVRAGFLMS